MSIVQRPQFPRVQGDVFKNFVILVTILVIWNGIDCSKLCEILFLQNSNFIVSDEKIRTEIVLKICNLAT